MEWLNYHHLLYFWTVAREGSVARAAASLRLAQSTVSGQIRALEQALGARLLQRAGRGVVPTETGRLVLRYADGIFAAGQELLDVLRERSAARPQRLVVGVSDALPKLLACRLIEPGLRGGARLLCREDRTERLLGDLSTQGLDLVLSDAPLGPGARVRAYNHLLGECGVSFFAAPALAARLPRRFPALLDGAPLLLPGDGTALRRALEQWLARAGLRPVVSGEFDDSALLKSFGQVGTGVFPAPRVVEREVCRQYRVRVLGRAEEVRERFYAISAERKVKHPAVIAICEAARQELFA